LLRHLCHPSPVLIRIAASKRTRTTKSIAPTNFTQSRVHPKPKITIYVELDMANLCESVMVCWLSRIFSRRQVQGRKWRMTPLSIFLLLPQTHTSLLISPKMPVSNSLHPPLLVRFLSRQFYQAVPEELAGATGRDEHVMLQDVIADDGCAQPDQGCRTRTRRRSRSACTGRCI